MNKIIGKRDGWELRMQHTSKGWLRLRLANPEVRRTGIGRGRFWLYHDGRRFGRGCDFDLLADRFPEVLAWAQAVICDPEAPPRRLIGSDRRGPARRPVAISRSPS